MLSHIGIPVRDIERSKAFYEMALAPLGLKVTMTVTPDHTVNGGTAIGFGSEGRQGLFWIGDKDAIGEGLHVAFKAEDHASVDAFYAAAIGAGGRDNGLPGFRPNYGPGYYAAFVFDPDGVNVEAVCEKA